MNFLRAGIVTIICLLLFLGFSPFLQAATFYSCDNQITPGSYCSNLGCTGYQEVKPPATNAGCQCTGCERACARTCGLQSSTWSNSSGCTCGADTSKPTDQATCNKYCTNSGHDNGVWEPIGSSFHCVCYDDSSQTTPTDAASCDKHCKEIGSSSGTWNDKDKKCTCADKTNPTDPSTGGSVTIGPPFGASGPQSIGDLIKNITDWVLGLSGAVAVLFIIIAGFRYITAHGDSKQTEAAKTALRNAIIGLVIVILSFFIVRIIITILSGQA